MKKWKISLIVVLVVTGLTLIFINPIKEYLVTSYHPNITRSVIKKNEHQHKRISYDMSKVKSVTAQQVINARMKANDISIVGQMVVPQVNLHLPVALGVDNNTLMLAAGTMRANQKMGYGNYALAGHHMLNKRALFTPLYDGAKVGTKVYLTDLNHVYEYQITTRKIISPYNVGVIYDTKNPLITLITCNDSGSKRLLLRGALIKKMKLNQAPKKVIKLLNKDTNNHDVLKGY